MSKPDETQEIENALATTSNAVTAMHRKFNIPGDVVFKATADLPDWQRNAIRGMHGYAVENDMSLAEQAKELKWSEATISLVYRGKYSGKLDGVCKDYAAFLKLQAARAGSRKLEFIETDFSRDIFRICDRAREFQKVGFIFGDAQIGKSESLKEYQRQNNHGQTIYVEIPTGGGLMNFCSKLAQRLKISSTSRFTDMRRRILESFDDRMLLIADEGHRCIPGKYVSARALDTVDFIKEIYNERACGVVIAATNLFRDEMLNGEHAGILKQLLRRQLCLYQCPNKPSKGDLVKFAHAHGLDAASGPALELQNRVIDDNALGYWLTVMRVGKKVAAERKVKFDWAHVIDADAGLKSLASLKD